MNWWNEQIDAHQIEYLAADRWRQDRLKQLRQIFDDRIADGRPIEPAPYFALLQAELE